MGRFQAGQAPNIIPSEAVLEGTVRTFDRAVTAQIMERIRQLSEGIASAFRGSAQMEELASAPPLQNDPALTEDMAALAETLLGREKVCRLKEGGMGSEDFASYTYELPCAYLLLGAGVPQEDPRYGQPMHNPKVVFNEDVLPLGAGAADCRGHAPSGAVKPPSMSGSKQGFVRQNPPILQASWPSMVHLIIYVEI